MALTDEELITCEVCDTVCNAWVSCNGTKFVEIPAIRSIVETFTENNATQRRHSSSNGKFIEPCQEDSFTRNFAIESDACPSHHPSCYPEQGSIVWLEIFCDKDEDTGMGMGEGCKLQAKLTKPGKNLQNNNNDPREYSWSFEERGSYEEFGAPQCDGAFADANEPPPSDDDDTTPATGRIFEFTGPSFTLAG